MRSWSSSTIFMSTTLKTATGIHAFEALIDPYTGDLYPEPGPSVMWNTKYGTMSGDDLGRSPATSPMTVTESQAKAFAQSFLDGYFPGVQALNADRFYGYYTLDFTREVARFTVCFQSMGTPDRSGTTPGTASLPGVVMTMRIETRLRGGVPGRRLSGTQPTGCGPAVYRRRRPPCALRLKGHRPQRRTEKMVRSCPGSLAGVPGKYRAELGSQREILDHLKQLEAEQGTLTLLYAAKDEERNNAVVLKQVLGAAG